MSYKAYPAYKDCGVEWFGKIPEEWEVKKLKHLATINMGQSPKSEDCEEYNEENPFLQGNAEFTSISPQPKLSCLNAPKKCSNGDILISVRAPVGEINIADQIYGIGRGLCALKGIKVNQRFLYYFMKYSNEILNVLSTGTTFKAISTDTLSFLKIFLPEEHTQTKIADFLDKETGLIDEMIEKKSRFIELLKEKRQALVTHAVTKGINPDVKMKDSGVEWLGEVPTDWNVKRTKYLFHLVTEQAPVDNQYELLSIYTDIGVKPRIELEQRGNKASTTDGYWKVKVGDLIVNKLLAWMGAIGMSAYEGVTSPAYDILRPYAGVESEYYHYLFRTIKVQRELKRWSRGLMDMRLRLYFDEFGKIYFPYPPTEQQKEIVQYIHIESDKIDSLISKTEESINLLKEKRSALITAAVTGKIDVREEA